MLRQYAAALAKLEERRADGGDRIATEAARTMLTSRVTFKRGDGFALAGAFAQVAAGAAELGPVLEAHLYAACPMAVPALRLAPATGEVGGGDAGGEHELMESLGMIQDKGGEFESFDKFLSRTEVSDRWLVFRCDASPQHENSFPLCLIDCATLPSPP